MAGTGLISRRPPPQLPEFSGPAYGGAGGWERARGYIYRFLKWAIDNYSGIPGGFKSATPKTVLVGGTASPGTEGESWMSAGAQLVITPGTPVPVGTSSAEGTTTTGSRGDHRHNAAELYYLSMVM
jgi:hypothetical protein